MQTGWPVDFAENVPAGHVDAGLDVGVSLQGGIHAAVQFAELQRILAEQMRPQLGDAGAHTVGVSGQIERTQRTDLAPAGDAAVGFDFDHGAVEHRNRFAARPLVTALVQRQFDPIGADALDLHAANPRNGV